MKLANLNKLIVRGTRFPIALLSFAAAAILSLGPDAKAQTYGLIPPYTNDTHTVLLDHFDASTSAEVLAYVNGGPSCTPRTSTTPNLAYSSEPPGLNQGLFLYPPLADLNARTYLKYPGGELLNPSNGTLECWVYLTNYDFYAHQLTYVGECQGDVGGMDVTATGQLHATIFTSISFATNV